MLSWLGSTGRSYMWGFPKSFQQVDVGIFRPTYPPRRQPFLQDPLHFSNTVTVPVDPIQNLGTISWFQVSMVR
jgi:hypothetical protein